MRVFKRLSELVTGVAKDKARAEKHREWLDYVQHIGINPQTNRLMWRVRKPLRYECSIGGKKRIICVPVGFVTDLASIPQEIWSLYGPYGTYTLAAIIHDYCTGTHLYPFKDCDLIFYHAMKWLRPHTPWRTRTLFYYAVRTLGEAVVYRNHTPEKIADERLHQGYCRPEKAKKLGVEICPFAKLGLCDIPKDDGGS